MSAASFPDRIDDESRAYNKHITLSEADARKIIAGLKKPFRPNDALRRAMLEAARIEKNTAEKKSSGS